MVFNVNFKSRNAGGRFPSNQTYIRKECFYGFVSAVKKR
jgi:hypothetical protein